MQSPSDSARIIFTGQNIGTQIGQNYGQIIVKTEFSVEDIKLRIPPPAMYFLTASGR